MRWHPMIGRFDQTGELTENAYNPIWTRFAMASAARMATCMIVKVGFALPEAGNTDALATLTFGM